MAFSVSWSTEKIAEAGCSEIKVVIKSDQEEAVLALCGYVVQAGNGLRCFTIQLALIALSSRHLSTSSVEASGLAC